MKKTWGDKPYNNLNYFLREKFGEKVFKISLDAGFSCPNRDGNISTIGCTFCSERGSGDFAGDREFSIEKQFIDIREMMSQKWKGDKYIAYFQAYTNTYGELEELKAKYDEAVNQEGVVALAIATRPDCLDEDIINLIKSYEDKVYTWIELGLQTSNDRTARMINRGYELNVFEDALNRLRENNIDVVAHVIFGLPLETKEDMLETVDYLAHKDIQGIKLHLLHLMKNTPMVKQYEQGVLKFIEMDEYVELIGEAISMLPENIVIHRITGDAPRDLLIGPMWSLKKWEVMNAIHKNMEDKELYQGKNYK